MKSSTEPIRVIAVLSLLIFPVDVRAQDAGAARYTRVKCEIAKRLALDPNGKANQARQSEPES
jgi:hypothetical protein